MKSFAELEKEVGFGLAVAIQGKDLPESFYKELNFQKWQEVYMASKGTSMREDSLKGMYNAANLFSELFELYNLVPKENKGCQEAVLGKMYKKAKTIDEYIEVHNLAPVGSDLRKEIRKTINGFL